MIRQKKQIMLLLIIALCMAGLFVLLAWLNNGAAELKAEKGRMESDIRLSDSYFPLLLTGQWQKYEGYITPAETDNAPWSYSGDLRYAHSREGNTYRAELYITAEEEPHLLLASRDDYALWLDGIQVVTTKDRESHTEMLIPIAPYLADGKVDIVMQVHGEDSFNGTFQGLVLSTEEKLSRVQHGWIILDMVAIGIYLLMMVEALSLFGKKKEEKYLLLLAVLAVFNVCTGVVTTRYSAFMLFPQWLLNGMNVLYQVFRYHVPLSYELCRSLLPVENDRMERRIYYILWVALSGIPMLLNLCGIPLPWLDRQIVSTLFLAFEVLRALRAFLRKDAVAVPILIGMGVYIALRIFMHMIETAVLPVGPVDVFYLPRKYAYVAYLFGFMQAVNGRFAGKFRQADELALLLEKTNASLEEKVKEQTVALEESYRSLVEAQEARLQFVSGVTHNLRSPLQTISGYTDMVGGVMEKDPERARRHLAMIRQNIDHMRKMTDDLIMATKLDDGKLLFEIQRFRLLPLVQQLRDNCAAADGKQVKIDAAYAENAWMEGDRHYTLQALSNIADNAMTYCREKVVFSLRKKEGQWWLSIANDGPHIPPEDLPQIFDRYFTGSGHRGTSTGLGLFVAREILQMQGCVLRATNTEPEGVVFEIRIPAGTDERHIQS